MAQKQMEGYDDSQFLPHQLQKNPLDQIIRLERKSISPLIIMRSADLDSAKEPASLSANAIHDSFLLNTANDLRKPELEK
jgi:hypothetical protein